MDAILSVPIEKGALVQRRAHDVTNASVEAEGQILAFAFKSDNVLEIKQTLYRVFGRIYLAGYRDGRS